MAFSSNFEQNQIEIHPESDGTEGADKEKDLCVHELVIFVALL